ncbi:hypothetical protein GJ633_14745 [Halorubrum sp. CBA1125]|uniref:hypothetical protein n=1 Tax=Halorubrum sp. CBA1125 TaxID=2668072 RepID=UPI0012E95750|nr:hypothetical protein [Halorubrum sp. CBA1125]MUW15740.1 hypothetical protein [Halorubrum sp. CBA1125]
MRSVLSELAQQGEVDRVGKGQYVATEAEAETDGSNDADDVDDWLERRQTDQDEQMPTTGEYEEQHSGVFDASDGEDAGDDVGSEVEVVDVDDPDDSDDDPDGDTAPAPSLSLPMDPKTLGMLLAAALVLWLAYQTLTDSSDDSDDSDDSDGADVSDVADGAEQAAEEITGGLAG